MSNDRQKQINLSEDKVVVFFVCVMYWDSEGPLKRCHGVFEYFIQ